MVMRRVSIDPGEVHCGVALWRGGTCYEAYEVSPAELIRRMEMWLPLPGTLGIVDEVVCESFHLYPAKAKEQSFSQFFTCEVIGVLRYLAKRGGVPFIEQPASIKKPTAAIVKARKIELKAKGHGQHAIDAEWHGWYRVWNPTREETPRWI